MFENVAHNDYIKRARVRLLDNIGSKDFDVGQISLHVLRLIWRIIYRNIHACEVTTLQLRDDGARFGGQLYYASGVRDPRQDKSFYAVGGVNMRIMVTSSSHGQLADLDDLTPVLLRLDEVDFWANRGESVRYHPRQGCCASVARRRQGRNPGRGRPLQSPPINRTLADIDQPVMPK